MEPDCRGEWHWDNKGEPMEKKPRSGAKWALLMRGGGMEKVNKAWEMLGGLVGMGTLQNVWVD